MRTQNFVKTRGFTLIELVIAVTIVGILMAIAIPAYNQYAMRAKRADAMQALMSAAAAFERYRSVNNFTYLNACVTGEGCANEIFDRNVPADGGAPTYLISSNVAPNGRTFTLTATPQGSQASQDGALTLTNTGVRTWTNAQGAVAPCWPSSTNAC